VHQIQRLLLDEELNAIEEVLQHQLTGFAYMFRFCLIIAFVVFFLALDRHQILVTVHLWEENFVLEELKLFPLGCLARF
jgi:hypothetical protein